jgi:hypothetical protein
MTPSTVPQSFLAVKRIVDLLHLPRLRFLARETLLYDAIEAITKLIRSAVHAPTCFLVR